MLIPWERAVQGFAPAAGSFAERVHATAAAVEQVTGHEPAAIALSGPDDLVPAVHVVCPGAGSRMTRTMPR
ncbi:hypothetical protein ACWGKU_15135 [Kitasatospora sp. NPDC054768]|uniref:hypothetical protein n=1 Tax=Kitasatospora sp. NBC_01519 TaxID=2903576 RepID=UPI002F919B6F